MKTKAIFIALCLTFFTVSLTWAQGSEFTGGGLLYGPGYSFTLKPPAGWVLNNQVGVDQGFDAVFYPQGSSWSEAPAVMYANGANKKQAGVATLQGIIEKDAAKFKQKNPQIVITVGTPLKTNDGKTAQVRIYRGDKWGNQEAVAYIDEPAAVAVLVLSARNPKDFQKSLPAFEKLVGSYHFHAAKVKISNPKDTGN